MTRTATATPETDEFLRILREKQTRHDETGAALREPQERRTATLAIASEAAETQRLASARRAELLDKAGEYPAAFDQLAQLETEIAALAQRESHAREAAERFTAEIAALTPAHQASQRAVVEARLAILERDHQVETARLKAKFEALEPEAAAWLVSAKQIDHQRKIVHGHHMSEDNDGAFRLMRAWTVWSRAMFGRLCGPQRVHILEINFGDRVPELD